MQGVAPCENLLFYEFIKFIDRQGRGNKTMTDLLQCAVESREDVKARILLIDDEESLRFTFQRFLENEGHEVTSACGFDEAMSLVHERDFDVIFADILLGGRSGIDFLRAMREKNSAAQVVMITGYPNVETASEAVRLGAFDYIPKPVSKKALLRVTDAALRHKQLCDENARYRSNLEAIFRSVSDAIITVDSGLILLEANQAAEKICRIDRENAGRRLSEIAETCDGECIGAMKTCIAENRQVEIHHHSCQRNGKVVNIIAAPLVNGEGSPYGCVTAIRDETRLFRLERELKERRQFHKMTGGSEKMQKIYALIEDLVDVQTTVLITGESGTGKELIADALHYKGPRCDDPLVKVNCSALSEDILESELFGHVKGAFTGAIRDKTGRFQMAAGGTIFLDEIGDLSPKVQLKLLRVLQEKEFERVGESTPVKVDVRIIAATNKDLRKKIGAGEFREDLFYRLKVVEISVPPLRERKEDIPLLIEHFLLKCADKTRKKALAASKEVERICMEYHWPGNIRELEHAIEHACIVSRGPVITPADLPPELTDGSSPVCGNNKNNIDEILKTLEKTDWNISKSAKLLGMSRPLLYKKIREIKDGKNR